MLFRDDYFFLSNFYPCQMELELDGKTCRFGNSEAAFQAQNPEIADKFSQVKGLEAKRLGAAITITTPDWDNYRLYAMAKALCAKFSQNRGLYIMLTCIKDDIVEDNY